MKFPSVIPEHISKLILSEINSLTNSKQVILWKQANSVDKVKLVVRPLVENILVDRLFEDEFLNNRDFMKWYNAGCRTWHEKLIQDKTTTQTYTPPNFRLLVDRLTEFVTDEVPANAVSRT